MQAVTAPRDNATAQEGGLLTSGRGSELKRGEVQLALWSDSVPELPLGEPAEAKQTTCRGIRAMVWQPVKDAPRRRPNSPQPSTEAPCFIAAQFRVSRKASDIL